MDQNFLQALAATIREQVVQKNNVEVEGLGRFEHEHQKQRQEQFDNGQVVMLPPRDTLEFIPENKS